MLAQEDRDRLIRIDERTATLVKNLEGHLGENRDDFKEVHQRINRVVAKQNIILGTGTGIGAAFGAAFVWVKGMMGS